MEWTMGSLMFYGGLAGAALTAIAAVIAMLALKRSKKNINSKFNDEYGGDSL